MSGTDEIIKEYYSSLYQIFGFDSSHIDTDDCEEEDDNEGDEYEN